MFDSAKRLFTRGRFGQVRRRSFVKLSQGHKVPSMLDLAGYAVKVRLLSESAGPSKETYKAMKRLVAGVCRCKSCPDGFLPELVASASCLGSKTWKSLSLRALKVWEKQYMANPYALTPGTCKEVLGVLRSSATDSVGSVHEAVLNSMPSDAHVRLLERVLTAVEESYCPYKVDGELPETDGPTPATVQAA